MNLLTPRWVQTKQDEYLYGTKTDGAIVKFNTSRVQWEFEVYRYGQLMAATCSNFGKYLDETQKDAVECYNLYHKSKQEEKKVEAQTPSVEFSVKPATYTLTIGGNPVELDYKTAVALMEDMAGKLGYKTEIDFD